MQKTGGGRAAAKTRTGLFRLFGQRGAKMRAQRKPLLESALFPWILGAALTLFLTLLVTANLSAPSISYRVGDVAMGDIKAPQDMRVVDALAADAARQKARDAVMPHYDIDPKLRGTIEGRLGAAFAFIQKKLTEQRAAVRNRLLEERAGKGKAILAESLVYAEVFRSPSFQTSEETFGKSTGAPLRPALADWLREERYASWIRDDMRKLVRAALVRDIVSDRRLYAAHSAKGIVVRDIRTGNRVSLPPSSRPLELREAEAFMLKEAGRLGLRAPAEVLPLLAGRAAQLIQPTLTFNNQATVEAQKEAAAKVPLVSLFIKRGEMIVREGALITEGHRAKLLSLERLSRQERILDNLLGTGLIVLLLLSLAWACSNAYGLSILKEPKSLLLFVLLFAVQAALIKLGVVTA
ncbi:MAG: hypothetical protein V3V62_13255, partial [bacterium]